MSRPNNTVFSGQTREYRRAPARRHGRAQRRTLLVDSGGTARDIMLEGGFERSVPAQRFRRVDQRRGDRRLWRCQPAPLCPSAASRWFESRGVASSSTVLSGGNLLRPPGGTAEFATIDSGGTATIPASERHHVSGGTFFNFASATSTTIDGGTAINSGAAIGTAISGGTLVNVAFASNTRSLSVR